MPRFKRSALMGAVCLLSLIFYSTVGWSQSPQPTVRLTTNPPINQLLPFEAEAAEKQTPVSLKLQAIDAAGDPLKDAKIHLQILTPPKSPWFTTDFPIVEGTELLELEVDAPQGELQFQQILPIRGTYQLLVEVIPQVESEFTPIKQTLTLSVSENSVKYRNLFILAVILLAVGFGGGWVIGERQLPQSGEIVSQRVRLLLSSSIVVAIAALLVFNISAELAHSQDHQHQNKLQADVPSMLQSQGLQLKLSANNYATVGQPNTLIVQATDVATSQPVNDVVLDVKVTQTGADDQVFSYQGKPDASGQLAWRQQFFDGAPHHVEVEVAPQSGSTRQFQPFQIAQDVEVEGIEPPLVTRLISLAYFTSLIGLGLALGFWQQRKRNRKTLLSHRFS